MQITIKFEKGVWHWKLITSSGHQHAGLSTDWGRMWLDIHDAECVDASEPEALVGGFIMVRR